MSDIAARALRLLESCQMPGYDPEGAETYPAVEDGGVNSIGNALAAAQVLASLAVAEELRRLNEGRDQWYREVLGVLTQARDLEGSPVGSEQPAAAPVCQVCGHAPDAEGDESAKLTYEQWNQHLNSWFRWRRSEGDEKAEAWRRAFEEMETRFGPCPEES